MHRDQSSAIEAIRLFLKDAPRYMTLLASDVDKPEERISDIHHILSEMQVVLVAVAAVADTDMVSGNVVNEWSDYRDTLKDALSDYIGAVEKTQLEYRHDIEDDRYARKWWLS